MARKDYKDRELEIYDEGFEAGSQTMAPRGTYQCFHCCTYGVVWDSDFDFEDFGYEEEGIVHICHCANCGAEIEYKISLENPEEIELKNTGDV